MDNKLETVLNKIKEKCPELMELSFGCELKPKEKFEFPQYIFSDSFVFINESGGGPIADTGDYDEYIAELKELTTGELYRDEIDVREDFTIIGHEPRLEHLLRAIKESECLMGIELYGNESGLNFDTPFGTIPYDLTKSVEQNLEQNEPMLDFIYSLFNQDIVVICFRKIKLCVRLACSFST